MTDHRSLMTLTAELHESAHDPQRLVGAWQALCRAFDCPEVFGAASGEPDRHDDGIAARIASCATVAGRCADAGSGRCGGGVDEPKRQACQDLVRHLGAAVRSAGALASQGRSASEDLEGGALDALPLPLMICDGNRRLLRANRAATVELLRERWLGLLDGRVTGIKSEPARRFQEAFSAVAAARGQDQLLPAEPLDGREAQIGIRRIDEHGPSIRILVSLITVGVEPSQAQLEKLAERRVLPPRQRELAGLLLDGLSLGEAADRMGISRRTANDHLKGLFRATGTRRQQDLLVRLAREMLVG